MVLVSSGCVGQEGDNRMSDSWFVLSDGAVKRPLEEDEKG